MAHDPKQNDDLADEGGVKSYDAPERTGPSRARMVTITIVVLVLLLLVWLLL